MPGHVHRVGFDPWDVQLNPSEPWTATDHDELREHLRRRFTDVCDPHTFPAYTFATIERPDHYTVISAFDHTLVDGYSIAIALGELRAIYEEFAGRDRAEMERAGLELHESLGEPGSFLQYCRLEAESSPAETSDPRVQAWAQFYERCGGTAPSFPLDLGVEAGHPAPQGADVRTLLSACETEAFERACLAAGGSVYTGTLTAMTSALRDLTGLDELPLQYPLHTRRDPQWAGAIGWLTTSAPMVAHATGDFDADLRATHAEFRTGLTLGGVRMPQVVEALGERYRRTRTDVFMVSYIDYRKLPGTDQHDVLNAHHISNVTVADDAQFWISRTTTGLALRSRFPDTARASESMSAFLDLLVRTMRDVCERSEPVGSVVSAGAFAGAPIV
ncbi:hypothetical protein [Rhodococcus rhodnii]|uniref:Condensation domain-containing protein n=1 Tax=Rhodococcus rhodnii LMG 5362 TaxID=1273125 RepID=R7WJE7_9NOCA|nr:hypothetical protein [Rhodococcus rhodnii]EOM75407.1 hypothetical protein Rrhod_3205 [Rhodococcus rhodnii LMG 5362]